jgi:hypothetical protein
MLPCSLLVPKEKVPLCSFVLSSGCDTETLTWPASGSPLADPSWFAASWETRNEALSHLGGLDLPSVPWDKFLSNAGVAGEPLPLDTEPALGIVMPTETLGNLLNGYWLLAKLQ